MKRLILSGLRHFGYELVPSPSRGSLYGVLANAKRCGFSPSTAIDVGAGRGDFSRLVHRLFPDVQSYLLIEPLEEFTSVLRNLSSEIPNARHVGAVASDMPGTAVLNVHPDLFGSSLLHEDEDSDVNGVPREVVATTLDRIASDQLLSAPYILKVDVQGAELKVLSGGTEVLSGCEMVILETSFFQFFGNAPLFHEILAWMSERGFLVYDIFGLAHRPLDGALAQADIVFVPKRSPLRKNHFYASCEQRASLTKRLRS